MQTQSKSYFVYRAHLAQCLFASGYTGEVIPNAMHPEKKAWSFDLSPDLARFIRDYYNDHDLSAPRFLIDYIAEHGGEARDE